MFLGEVIKQLRDEGFLATDGRIHHAIRTGYVHPPPAKNALGARVFRARHLHQLRDYLVNVRPGPKPMFPTESFPAEGYFDSRVRLRRRVEVSAQIASIVSSCDIEANSRTSLMVDRDPETGRFVRRQIEISEPVVFEPGCNNSKPYVPIP